MNTLDIMSANPVIPVVVLDDVAQAVPLAHALRDGGVGVIELTLRSPAALRAIETIAAEVPDVIIGAGTVLTPADADAAIAAGARFLVSPGSTARLMDAAHSWPVPWLPGVSTAGEAMSLADAGHTEMKFFPAEFSGGANALGALAGPLPHLTFCPTGGISTLNADSYLRLQNVRCVGGSWLTPRAALAEGRWHLITELARATTTLPTS